MEMTVGCKKGQVGPVKAGTDAGEGMRGRVEQGKSGGKEGEGGEEADGRRGVGGSGGKEGGAGGKAERRSQRRGIGSFWQPVTGQDSFNQFEFVGEFAHQADLCPSRQCQLCSHTEGVQKPLQTCHQLAGIHLLRGQMPATACTQGPGQL